MKKAREWRQALEQPFGALVAVLENADSIELTNLSSVAGVVQAFAGTLVGSVDILLDLLFAYAPELAKDRERIENEAYDEEALAALVEVLKLAYPFGTVLGLVTGSKTTPKGTSPK
tara:strand:- start:541 stop:888 length:348 start_codon:yes stop_codon:yes gene_type:complete